MRRLLILSCCLALALCAACDKTSKDDLERLRQELDKIKSEAVGVVPEAGKVDVPGQLDIIFDKESYWVDAAGSVAVHYTLTEAATLQVSAQEGWSTRVNAANGTEGEIVVTAPDPASPGLVTIKATTDKGISAETMLQVKVRRPCTDATCPTIDALAYNGFNPQISTLENFQKLADAGMTIITVEGAPYFNWREQARNAESTGVKVILFINIQAGLYSEDPENYKGLDELVLEAIQYPAIVAFQIADEPSTELAYYLKTSKDRIEALAPNHPVYINLHPSTVSQAGMMALTYEDYVEYYASVCDLKFITFDEYPIFKTGVEDAWYRSLRVIYDTAKRHGVPFWAFIQSCREYSRVDPSVETMRLQGNVNLAYGAQCNQFFVWKATSGTNYAPIMDDGTYTEAYDDCKAYLKEMHSRDFVFAGCDVRSVRHLGIDYYLHGTCLTEADYPEEISEISSPSSTLVSFIGNSGNEYVVICNKAWNAKLPVNVTFTKEVYTIDREGVFTSQEPGRHQFTLDEGDMMVIKLK